MNDSLPVNMLLGLLPQSKFQQSAFVRCLIHYLVNAVAARESLEKKNKFIAFCHIQMNIFKQFPSTEACLSFHIRI